MIFSRALLSRSEKLRTILSYRKNNNKRAAPIEIEDSPLFCFSYAMPLHREYTQVDQHKQQFNAWCKVGALRARFKPGFLRSFTRGVTGHEPTLAQKRNTFRVILHQTASQTQLHCVCLPGYAATLHMDSDVKSRAIAPISFPNTSRMASASPRRVK